MLTFGDQRRRLFFIFAVVALFLLVIHDIQLVNGQDFGFPEETDQKKEQKNADVSIIDDPKWCQC